MPDLTPRDHAIFHLGPTVLQSGLTLPQAHIAYKTYGRLNAENSNAILYPTSYGAHHTDIDWLIGPGRVLDPEAHFIVIPNQFGNGLSSSPSNLAEPYGQGQAAIRYSRHWDNVAAQRRLLDRGVRHRPPRPRLRLVDGRTAGAALGRDLPAHGRCHLRRVHLCTDLPRTTTFSSKASAPS